MIIDSLHPKFKLNGIDFRSKTEILRYTNNHVKEIHPFLASWFDESDFINVQTSGSTGEPKIIQLKKEFMVNSAKATGSFFDLGEKTTALLCLNVQFIAGKMMLVRAMVLGWELDTVYPNSNPLGRIDKQYDFSAMTPMQVSNSIERISQIKKLIIGGGIISRELKDKIKLLSTSIFQTYGMTESITHIAVRPLNKPVGLINENDYYQTLPGTTIDQDERGCLIIMPSNISDKVLVTNDIIEIYSDTTFKWLGREDHIINSGGIKLLPEQIEVKLENLIKERFFVYGKADTVLGEKLILIVEGSEQVDLMDKIIDFQRKNPTSLHKYEIPKDLYFVMKFVETATKKIKRKEVIDIINS